MSDDGEFFTRGDAGRFPRPGASPTSQLRCEAAEVVLARLIATQRNLPVALTDSERETLRRIASLLHALPMLFATLDADA